MENQSTVDKLVTELLKSYDLEADGDIKVTLSADNSKFVFEISGTIRDNKQKAFEEWCDTLDEDLFVEACEVFEERAGYPLSELKDHYQDFINVVKDIVREKIESLKVYL